MEQYILSNSSIDLACEETGKFLASAGVERREALRVRLTLEEVLLQYQEKLGEDGLFRLRLVKRLSSIRVELIVPGESYDALGSDREEDDVIRSLLAGIGLAPAWSYKSGRNHIIFTPKKKPLSSTTKMIAAIVLAVIAGILLNLLPENIRTGVNNLLLTPVSNALTGLISAVSGPLIFLSVLGSICSMGNMETLGKIGSKTIKVILLYMAVISVLMTGVAILFYQVEWSGGTTSSFSQVLGLIYGIVPSNLFEPFVTGNALQLIFIAIMVGLAMLALSSRVNRVFKLVEQISFIVQTIMTGLSSMLPILIFFLLVGMNMDGNFGTTMNPFKMLVVIALLLMAYYVVSILRIAIMKSVSPILLFKKTWPTLLIALTTASSAAAFSTNVRDAECKFGIDKKIADFAIPLGQVLFKPAVVAILIGMELTFAELYGIPVNPSFLTIALITNLLLSFSVPPVPGGGVMCYTIAFSQLGIPMEAIGVALAVDALADFPATACDLSSWQFTLIEIADSLDMLDKETLHSNQ